MLHKFSQHHTHTYIYIYIYYFNTDAIIIIYDDAGYYLLYEYMPGILTGHIWLLLLLLLFLFGAKGRIG